eukprot:CAMPEP_0176408520 /NCGR_PEP_ID=MMETSP0127-20121128/1997_1 /TAXON_ID=938130 /ORGANISM="Platyophrya macrostoma, Strain WH" /LENGTH=158 /DNA_ID=CAMNT_0017787815 /DNA_START=88 /DNA_END=564 /DNA_ORIENTATION=+
MNKKIDTNHLPLLVKYLKMSRWNEFNHELEEFSKTVQQLQALKLARISDELNRSIESAMENMFFDNKEIKTVYVKFLQELRAIKKQMGGLVSIEPAYKIIDDQIKDLETVYVEPSTSKPENFNPYQDSMIVSSKTPETKLEEKSAPKDSQCCSGCKIF